jgi:hypothetical protein
VELAECNTGVEPVEADESGPEGKDTVEEDDDAEGNVDENDDDDDEDSADEDDEDEDDEVGGGPFKGLPSVMLKPDFFALALAADDGPPEAVEPGVLRCKSCSAVARTMARLCSTDAACSFCCCCSMVAIEETCCCCCGGEGRGNRSGELGLER